MVANHHMHVLKPELQMSNYNIALWVVGSDM